MISTAGPGIEHLPPPAEVPGSWGCRMRSGLLGKGGQRGGLRSAAGVFWPAPAASSHSDRWTHDGIVNVGEAEPFELIVQGVVPAAVAGHMDFQGVEIFPVPLGALPQDRARRLAKDFAVMTMAFPI